jgi:serine protease Do
MESKKKAFYIILIIFLINLVVLYSPGFRNSYLSLLHKAQKSNEIKTLTEPFTYNEDKKVVYVDEEDAVINVVEKSSTSVVSVVKNNIYYDDRSGPVREEDSIGTGFIINGKTGIVLTNKHVVDDANATYSIILNDGKTKYEVTQIARDPVNDFSILKVDLEGATLSELRLANSDGIKIGQTVVAIGNALGEFGNSVTKGIVSGLNREIFASSGYFGDAEFLENVIQTDAALNPGNSGGPLLNLQGEVIGINVAISQGAENIGFAIPINAIKASLDQFNQNGKISRPFLGVEYRLISQDIAQTRNLPIGAFIENVVPNSPASKAGIRAGDIITQIDGTQIDDGENSLAKIISKKQVGANVELVIDRDGQSKTLYTKIEENPN